MKYVKYDLATHQRKPSEPIRLVHAADLHLGRGRGGKLTASSATSNYGIRTVSVYNEQRQSGFRVFKNLLNLVVEQQADLLLLAGDILEIGRLTPAELRYISDSFADLPYPVLIVAGNHDPLTDLSPYRRLKWPENVFIFPGEWTALDLPAVNLTVWGRSFTSERQSDTMLPSGTYVDWCDELAHPELATRTSVGMLHGEVVVPGGRSYYNPLTETQLAATKLSYLALGHIHKPRILELSTCALAAYSGCLYGTGFDEQGPRGADVVTLPYEEKPTVEFHALAEHEFYDSSLMVNWSTSLQANVNTVMEAIRRDDAKPADNFYRLHLSGELPSELSWTWAMLVAELQQNFYDLTVYDETEAKIDLIELKKEFSLRGLVAAAAWQEISICTDPHQKHELQAALQVLLQIMHETKA